MDHGEIAEAQSSTSAVGATQNAAVTIINRHLNIGPFELTRDRNDTAVRWALRISSHNSDFSVLKTHN